MTCDSLMVLWVVVTWGPSLCEQIEGHRRLKTLPTTSLPGVTII